ncbi:MAG: ABC transporter ATP-binding protein [Candidatus Levyibacteriota bacterium]|nr:MAG: ABC transporter ATP-binding protein [Candidatus Levybacteria bacterium]
MSPILDVKNLTKQFGSFTAVNDISFFIQEGEVLGLLGPNGAGKTTTIQMLLGVMEQTKGEVSYFNKSFKNHREEILKQVNYSSTYISLPWLFTVSEILECFARLYEIPDKQKRIDKLLKEFEIEDVKKKQFFMLSAGEKTRVLLVKAFLNYPRVLLLDEPTASLDPEIAIKVREFLKKEKQAYNVSMLFTSHNMSEVEEMCDRIIILDHGKIIDEDTPEKLANKITECKISLTISKDTKKAISFLEKQNLLFTQDRFIFTVPIREKRIAEFLTILSKENITYEEISIDKPNLEDYFLTVIGEKHD